MATLMFLVYEYMGDWGVESFTNMLSFLEANKAAEVSEREMAMLRGLQTKYPRAEVLEYFTNSAGLQCVVGKNRKGFDVLKVCADGTQSAETSFGELEKPFMGTNGKFAEKTWEGLLLVKAAVVVAWHDERQHTDLRRRNAPRRVGEFRREGPLHGPNRRIGPHFWQR